MKLIIGILLILAGIALGLYAGVWWAFIGGIVQIVQAVRAEQLEAMPLAIGIAKVIFAGFIGYISALVLIVPGVALFND